MAQGNKGFASLMTSGSELGVRHGARRNLAFSARAIIACRRWRAGD